MLHRSTSSFTKCGGVVDDNVDPSCGGLNWESILAMVCLVALDRLTRGCLGFTRHRKVSSISDRRYSVTSRAIMNITNAGGEVDFELL